MSVAATAQTGYNEAVVGVGTVDTVVNVRHLFDRVWTMIAIGRIENSERAEGG